MFQKVLFSLTVAVFSGLIIFIITYFISCEIYQPNETGPRKSLLSTRQMQVSLAVSFATLCLTCWGMMVRFDRIKAWLGSKLHG